MNEEMMNNNFDIETSGTYISECLCKHQENPGNGPALVWCRTLCIKHNPHAGGSVREGVEKLGSSSGGSQCGVEHVSELLQKSRTGEVLLLHTK